MRLANLRAGALDLIERILPTDIPSVRSDPKLKLLLPTPPIAYTGLTVNLANTGPAGSVASNSLEASTVDLATEFEGTIQSVVAAVASSATEMQATAQSLAKMASDNTEQSNAVAASARWRPVRRA